MLDIKELKKVLSFKERGDMTDYVQISAKTFHDMIEEIESLRGRAGVYDDIEEFYRTDERWKPYVNRVSERLIEDGCYSMSIHILYAIESLLDDIDYWKESATQ